MNDAMDVAHIHRVLFCALHWFCNTRLFTGSLD